MVNKGWIKIYRCIQDHWLWESEPFDSRSAWIDLLLMVNHEPKKINISGQIVEIKAGQKWTSIRKLAVRWQWSHRKVEKFLKMLESDQMLIRDSATNGTLLTIVNYGLYQSCGDTSGNANEHTSGNDTGTRAVTQMNHKQEYKNDKECNKNEKEIGEAPPNVTAWGEEWQ